VCSQVVPDISDQQHIDMFKQEDAFEAILKRPDRDVGSVESLPQDIWLVSREVMEYFDPLKPEVAAAQAAAVAEAARIKREAKKAAVAAAADAQVDDNFVMVDLAAAQIENAMIEVAAAGTPKAPSRSGTPKASSRPGTPSTPKARPSSRPATPAASDTPKVRSRSSTPAPGTPSKRAAKMPLPVFKMSEERHSVVYALYKTVEEVFVNAADQKYSDTAVQYPLTNLAFDINRHTGEFGVHSNGKAIPCVLSKDGETYIPTMVGGTCACALASACPISPFHPAS
jgi:hypothetical protein